MKFHIRDVVSQFSQEAEIPADTVREAALEVIQRKEAVEARTIHSDALALDDARDVFETLRAYRDSGTLTPEGGDGE